jgi:hypothetical protein
MIVIVTSVKMWLRRAEPECYYVGIHVLVPRWHKGHTIAQAVSHQLHTAAARV